MRNRTATCILLLGLAAVCPAPARSDPLVLRAGADRVDRFARIAFVIEGVETIGNPFDPARNDVQLEIDAPDGVLRRLPCFWMQDYEQEAAAAGDRGGWRIYPRGAPGWRARYAPGMPGEHTATAVQRGPGGVRRSAAIRFRCVDSPALGYVRASRHDPRFLEFSTGEPFFPIGQNLAFIGTGQYMTPERTEAAFAQLARYGANFLRIWACCGDWAMAIEERKSAWGRSWDWRPPLVPMPGHPERLCLEMTGDRRRLDVDPSHPVALRPATTYRATARIRTSGDATVRLEALGAASMPAASGTDGHWQSLAFEFTTGATDRWLSGMRFLRDGTGTAWVADVSLQKAAGGPELLWEADANRPRRGVYNPVDCLLLDRVVEAAEQHGLTLQLCLLSRDLYMDALRDETGADYSTAIRDACNLLRYAVARWGYSTAVGAWEYWNEMDPGLPTDRFHAEVGRFLEQTDPYQHLRTTSTWGPSARDCRHPSLDIADTHFYLRPADRNRLRDEVDAVLDRTQWLREQAPEKPAHLGEFGLADDRWRITASMRANADLADVHNALWASALSGASGTALAWWWERIDQHNGYRIYEPLSAFLRDVPWTSGALQPIQSAAHADDTELVCIGLRAEAHAWLWLFDRRAAWEQVQAAPPPPVARATVTIDGLPPRRSCRIQWTDTRSGLPLATTLAETDEQGHARLDAPAFRRDVAARLQPAP